MRTLSENNSFRFFFFNFYTIKTLPYALPLRGKKGTADFGEFRHKNPILPCGIVA